MASTAAVRGSTLQLEKKENFSSTEELRETPLHHKSTLASCNVKFVIEACMIHDLNVKTNKSA